MKNFKEKFQINNVQIINFIFAFLPISFLLGNLITNLNILVLFLFAILQVKLKDLSIKLDLPFKIILLFFLIVLFSTSLSYIKSLYSGEHDTEFLRFAKSLLFFRFFIILIIIYWLSKLDIINFRYFFLTASVLPILLSLDLILQYATGVNIIGLKSYGHHNSSFFGDELIAGGFVQNFSFFSLIFLSYKLRNNNFYLMILLFAIVATILGIGILVSGNRMPIFLFLLGLFLIYFFNNKLKKAVIASFLVLSLSLSLLFSYDSHLKNLYLSLYDNVKDIGISVITKIKDNKSEFNLASQPDKEKEDPESAGHKKIFFTSIETWKMHKIFGSGIKGFRKDCKIILEKQKRGVCSNHPHNYYLEVLTDLGILGLISVMIIAWMFIIFLIKNYKFFNKNKLESLFLLATTISLCVAVFPIKSTGSIFTTNNATYIIALSSIVLCYKEFLKGKNIR